jgi:AbrB family looped-hinge helix DNA binding protein
MPNGKHIKERIVPLVKVGPNHEVVIPKNVRTKLGVNPGDYVEVSLQKKAALLTPRQETFPETDEPLGPKTRAAISRGLKDVEAGRVSGPFKTAADVQRHLDSLKK